jgi:hypothetical protein
MSIHDQKNRESDKGGKPVGESRRIWKKFLCFYVFYAAVVLGIGAKLGMFRGLKSTAAGPAAVVHPVSNPSVTNAPVQPIPLREGILAFDEEIKKVTVHEGDAEAHFFFKLSNVSKESVTVEKVETSCGCTVAQLPQVPWILKPGDKGEFGVTMDVRGNTGESTRSVTLFSSKGSKTLTVQATILPAAKHNDTQTSDTSEKPVVLK